MFKKTFFFVVTVLVISLWMTQQTKLTPIADNANTTNSFLSGPASKVYLVTPATEVLWLPRSGTENNIEMIY